MKVGVAVLLPLLGRVAEGEGVEGGGVRGCDLVAFAWAEVAGAGEWVGRGDYSSLFVC